MHRSTTRAVAAAGILGIVAVAAACAPAPAPSGPVALAWATPEGAPLQGTAAVVELTGQSLVNVEVFLDGRMIARAQVAADHRRATARIDTTALPKGSVQLTAHAWNSPPGDMSFTSEADAGVRRFAVGTAGGGAPSTTSVPAPTTTATTAPPTTTRPPATGGRSFLLGMFSSGSQVGSYPALLGYHPEVTYDSSYQDDHHKTCGQPISGLTDLNNYPVIPSVFTMNGDYAGSAKGSYDNCYETLFKGMQTKASTIYAVRIDVEFYPTPPAADFKGSFNRIVSIAKKYLPARVKYIFNPNWEQGLGASYVPESADIIGPDAYNNPQWCGSKTSAQCAADKLDPDHAGSIAYWTKIARQLGRPMALPEWGDDFGDGAYVNRIADWAYDKVLVTPGTSNNVVYLGYWDSTMNENGSLRGESAKVFQQRFGNVRYSGSYWSPLLPTTAHGQY